MSRKRPEDRTLNIYTETIFSQPILNCSIFFLKRNPNAFLQWTDIKMTKEAESNFCLGWNLISSSYRTVTPSWHLYSGDPRFGHTGITIKMYNPLCVGLNAIICTAKWAPAVLSSVQPAARSWANLLARLHPLSTPLAKLFCNFFTSRSDFKVVCLLPYSAIFRLAHLLFFSLTFLFVNCIRTTIFDSDSMKWEIT